MSSDCSVLWFISAMQITYLSKWDDLIYQCTHIEVNSIFAGTQELNKQVVIMCSGDGLNHQGPLLLTWINFNPSMDK